MHNDVMGVGPRSPQAALDEQWSLLNASLPEVTVSLNGKMVGGKYPEYRSSIFRRRPITLIYRGRPRVIDAAYVVTMGLRDKRGNFTDADPRRRLPIWYAGIAMVDGQAMLVDTERGEDGPYQLLETPPYARTWNIASLLGITQVLTKDEPRPLGM